MVDMTSTVNKASVRDLLIWNSNIFIMTKNYLEKSLHNVILFAIKEYTKSLKIATTLMKYLKKEHIQT